MNTLKIRKIISILTILSMILSIISPVLAEDLSEVTSIKTSEEDTVEVRNTIEKTTVVKDQNSEETKGEEIKGVEAKREEITSKNEDETKTKADKKNGEVKDPVEHLKLEVQSLSPKDGASGVAENEELSVTFNQEVRFKDNGTPVQVGVSYDNDDDGEVDTSRADYGDATKHELIFNEDDRNKVKIQLKDKEGNNIELEENHEYRINIIPGFIESKTTGEVIDEMITWTFDTKAQTKPLEVEENGLSPKDGACGVAENEELSVTFNQEVRFKDNGTPVQVGVSYDNDGDGEVDTSRADYGDATKHELIFNEDDQNKVKIQLKDKEGNNIELEENHEYRINIIPGFIESKTTGEVIDEMITWTFDTKAQTKPLEVEENGLSPKDGASGVAENEELSVTFNQEVRFKDNGTPVQVGVSYDNDGDGEVDTSRADYGDATKHELIFNEDDRNKVKIQLKDKEGNNIELEENHEYRINIIPGFIESKTTGEVIDEMITWTFDTKAQTKPLEVEENGLSPKDGASGVAENEELSVTFNQEVRFKDNGTPVQVGVSYDNDGDGEVDTSRADYGDVTKHELIFNENDRNKVKIQLKDKEGNNIELKENHEYRINIIPGFIESKTTGEVIDEMITWTFDTKPQTLKVGSPIDGKTISPEDEIFMKMSQDVDEDYVNGLHIYLYKDEELIKEGTGADIAELDDNDKKKIMIDLNNELEIGNAYKIKVCYKESGNIKDLITISFNVEDIGEYGLKIKLDFLRRESINTGMQDFIAASMNKGIVYAVRNNQSRFKGEENDEMGIRIYAFDLYGHELWNTTIDDIFTTNKSYMPVYGDDGTVYIQTNIKDYNNSEFQSQIIAIDPHYGRMKWKKEVTEEGLNRTNPLVIDDEIIITTKKGLYSYDKNGNKKWEYKINNDGLARDEENYIIEQSPIKDKDGNIYISINGENSGTKDGKIQVLNPDGSEKWSYITSDGIVPPVIDNSGNVYVVDNTCIIRVLNPSDGTIITDHPINDYVLKTSHHDYDIVSINIGVDNTIYAVINNNSVEGNKIIAINSNGTENYIYKDSNHVFGNLVIDNEGYAYYSEFIDGGEALFVIGPYGNRSAEILPVGSSTPMYNSIYIDGNVLIGAKSYFTNVIGARIERQFNEKPSSIEIIEKNKKFGENLNETLAVAVRNRDGKVMIGEELEWESSDDSIVEPASDGTLICKKDGSVDITVKVKGTDISDITRIEVIKKDPTPASIKILDENGEEITDELTVEYGIPYQFQVEMLDQYGKSMDDEKVIWFSIINYFPAIDHTGLLNPKSEGTYSLEAISCTDVRVTKEIIYKIEKGTSVYKDIFPKEAVMAFPGSMTLSPVDQYGKPIELGDMEWSSSNENIAIVNEEGKVTAVACGTTTITGTREDTTYTRELSVVPAFGYEWNVDSNKLYKFIDEGNNGEIYYIDRADNTELVSINSHNKTENWRFKIGSYVYCMEASQDGNIYCLVKDDDYKIIAIRPDKSIKWQHRIEGYAGSVIHNIEQAGDGTIYFTSSHKDIPSYLYSIDKDGNEKWQLEFDKEISSFTLDNKENIICVTKNSKDSVITKISDEESEGVIVEEEILENLIFGKGRGNIEIDDNGVVYGYFMNSEKKIGVCAVKDGDVKWKYYDEHEDYLADYPQIMLNDEGMLYFILKSDTYSYSLFKINNQGKEIWKKKLNNLTDAGRFLIIGGAFSQDNEGNVYLPANEVEITNWRPTYVKSKVLKLASDGEIQQFISYDNDKYGQFINIFFSRDNDSVYVIGKFSNDGDDLVKFILENNQEIKIDEIKITADKQSIIINEILDLKAEVYSQFGSVMTDEKVTWYSDGENIATVDSNGRVKGIKAGQVDIIVKSVTNPEIKGVFTITVVEANAHHISKDQIDKKTQSTIDYYKNKGIPQGDWIAFGLSAAGEDINKGLYLSNGRSYIDSLWNTISANDEFELITDYVKATLGILSGGYDPHKFGEMNLIEKIYSYGSLGQGNNAAVWALIALDAADAEVPEDKGYFTQEFLIDYLLEYKDGPAWSVDGEDIDIDVTGMALYALAPYKDRADVEKSVNETVEWLKKEQNEHGGFDCFGTDITNTESTAQIIMGLTALGIDPQDSVFTRGYGNPVSAMLNNQSPDGSFEHTKGTGSDSIATEQALQALAALKDFYENGKSTISYHIPYNKNIADVTVRIEGENKTLLSQTRVNITSGKTTLYDAVINALDEANIDYTKAYNNITSIDGEEGWQWLAFKDKILKANSSTETLYGHEEIILADESIANPVYSVLNVPTKELGVDKKFPVFLYGSNNQPIVGAEIIYYKDGQTPTSTGVHTDKNGKALITISEEGKFLISAEGQSLVRAKAQTITLHRGKEITVNIRVEGPKYTILPKTQIQVEAGDYPIEALRVAGLEVTYDKDKTDTDIPKTIDGVEGSPKWDIYPNAFGFDIPLEDGNDIIFTGNGTCYKCSNIFVPNDAEINKEFTVIVKDILGDSVSNEQIIYYKQGQHKTPTITGVCTDKNGKAQISIDSLGTYYISIIPDSYKHLVTPEAKAIEIKDFIPIDPDEVTVEVTIEGYRGRKILRNYEVTTDIFDLQPYLRPGTGPTAKPSNDWYEEKFDKPTVAHAVVKALEKKGIDYDFQDYGWGLYFAMIGGYREKKIKETSGWMYEINGRQGPGVQDQYLEDGDEIKFWFTVGGWEDPYLIGGDSLLEIINDEYATEEEILEALEDSVNEIKGQANKLKSEAVAEELVEDIEDMAQLIGKAEDRIDTEKGRKEAIKETINLMKALEKSSQIVKDKKIKTKIDKAAAAVIETIMKLMDKQKDLKEIDNILEEMIKISGAIKDKIGKENSKKLELEIINAIESAINKSSIKEVGNRDIDKKGDKAIVSIDTKLITETAEGLMERVKNLEEKLKDNNIDKNKKLEKKITIKIPTIRIEEVETTLPSGTLNLVEKSGINNIEIQTNIASFNITPNAFKEIMKDKEISLNAKIIDKGKISETAENTMPKGSVIVDLDAKVEGEKISAFEEPIEISIPYKEEVTHKEQVTVYLLKDDGTIEPVGGVYDPETKTVKFITNHFSKYFAKEASMSFNDLGKVSWARNEIETMAAKGIIKGRDSKKFDPNANITRAEFAALMTRMLKYTAENKDIPFKDITNDKWYYEEVAAAYENGLMKGISDEEFNPEGNITGQEAITVMERILVQKGYKEASLEELKGYSQKDNIAKWAKASVAFGLREGIINEDKKEGFVPNEKATRAQVAAILYRLYNLIMK